MPRREIVLDSVVEEKLRSDTSASCSGCYIVARNRERVFRDIFVMLKSKFDE